MTVVRYYIRVYVYLNRKGIKYESGAHEEREDKEFWQKFEKVE